MARAPITPSRAGLVQAAGVGSSRLVLLRRPGRCTARNVNATAATNNRKDTARNAIAVEGLRT